MKQHNNYRYQLAKKGKCHCPKCGKKTFVPYIDTLTGQPLDETVGKCDRADNCDYHYPPRYFFAAHPDLRPYQREAPRFVPAKEVLPSSIPLADVSETVKKTFEVWRENPFVDYLCVLLGVEAATEAIGRYRIGTFTPYSYDNWKNCTVFWQITIGGECRHGKVMQYGADGHRFKTSDGKARLTTYQRAMNYPDFTLKQCFFGEHLLQNNNLPVAIVESEKTAIIASVSYPIYVWLAAGGSNGLNDDKFRVLRGRKVWLFPDVGMFDKWRETAERLRGLYEVEVFDWTRGMELPGGWDIADVIEAKLKENLNDKGDDEVHEDRPNFSDTLKKENTQSFSSEQWDWGAPWEKYGLPY